MIALTEPQVWVLIAVFATAIFSMIGIVSVSFTRSLTAAIGGLEAKVEGQLQGMRGEIVGLERGLRGEIAGLRETMDARFELLDRDIQALSKRVFGAE